MYVYIYHSILSISSTACMYALLTVQGDGEADQEKDDDIGDLDDLLRREREMEKKRKESAPVDAEVQ